MDKLILLSDIILRLNVIISHQNTKISIFRLKDVKNRNLLSNEASYNIQFVIIVINVN